MANPKGNPQNLRPAKPGEVRNPTGRPKNLITHDRIMKIMGNLFLLTRAELEDVIKDPKTTYEELMVANIMAAIAKAGDASKWEALLSRAIGKVKDVQDVNVTNNPELAKVETEDMVSFLKDYKKTHGAE